MQYGKQFLTSFFLRLISIFVALQLVTACAETASPGGNDRILLMGDSLMAWNRRSGQSVAQQLEADLRQPVLDRSALGASVIRRTPLGAAVGLNIPQQFQPGQRDWIVLNGGGNDLFLGCGCNACSERLNLLASEDGKWGAIPNLLSRLRATGAQVIYVGYLRSPGVGSLIENCADEGNELERRLVTAARKDPGVHYVSLRDLVPHGDRSYHAFDLIHPSPKASRAIAARVANIIRK